MTSRDWARAREQGEQDLEVVRAALNDAVGYHYEAHPALDRIAAYIKELEVERELALRFEADEVEHEKAVGRDYDESQLGGTERFTSGSSRTLTPDPETEPNPQP